MKKILLLSAILIVTVTSARAQLSTNVTTLAHDHTFAMGRDFWFSFMSNYWGENLGGAYLAVYITSNVNTTAYLQYQSRLLTIPISAYQVGTFYANLAWEMQSSGIVTNQSVHVWSNDADLVVYTMNRNSATTDGSYIVPTIGWGTDYVVAAYGSNFEGYGSYVYDLPSTMAVTANEDNTYVSITPSCDCRQCVTGSAAGGANATTVVFPAGQTFTDTLMKGQDMQLMPVEATAATGFDMTGTIVHANVPVGVSGGSVCPNIPDSFPYCDHVEDMNPPVRTWGENYYFTNTEQAPGTPADHDFMMYLFVASKPNQAIYRSECDTVTYTECIIPNQYGYYWDELAGPQKFWSNAPFMLVSYLNSATYPDGSNGLGDPAEAHVNPRAQFTKSVLFLTPVYTGGQYPDPYYNYANITIRIKDATKTHIDGQLISNHPAQCLDSNWEIVPITDISAGAHLVTGDDSGVGVAIYGYGYDESYAWPTEAQCETFGSTDSIAPIAIGSGTCYSGHIAVFNSDASNSKLDMLRLDSDYNMTYMHDTSWEDGTVRDSTFYNMYVNDLTKPGYLQVSVFDYDGNHTTITTRYTPQLIDLEPPLKNLGLWKAGSPPNIAYDTIFNTGKAIDSINELQLLYNNVGFSLFDSTGGLLDLSPLAPGQRRLIQIQFAGNATGGIVDSILLGWDCGVQSVALIARGSSDFIASSNSFDTCLVGTQKTVGLVTVHDTSSVDSVVIDSIWTDNPVFSYNAATPASNTLPIALAPQSLHVLFVTFAPTAPIAYSGNLFIRGRSIDEGITSVPLTGTGYVIPALVQEPDMLSNWEPPAPNPASRSLTLNYALANAAQVTFDIFNILGERIYHWDGGLQNAGPHSAALDMGEAIANGSYIYRFEANGDVRSGNLEIER